ncbi:MAG: phosphatidylglycerophosphatase A [Alistipes senegalensis]|nr:phosphatidylglycerophosphatase A [Oxalobacter formigenes]MCM1281861.1 phosphatidylglycerophosphatase A [Alistipes senegalensis]
MKTPENPAARIRPGFRFLLSHPAHFVALGMGSGLSPVMPGTAGTLFGWLLFHLLTRTWPACFHQITWIAIVIPGFLLGIWACEKSGTALNSPDDGSMVWDEIIAIWLVLLVLMPTTWQAECLAFILFRLFDMTKPPPIRQLDAKMKGGLGVMLDDILAAAFTLIAYQLIVLLTDFSALR